MSEVLSSSVGDLVGRIEPGPFKALLEAAWGHECRGETRAAAATYRTALQMIPRMLPPSLRPVLEHAKAAVDANDLALEAFLQDHLGGLRHRFANQRLERFDQCLETLLRKRRVYRPSPSFLYFPQLPAVEFHDRADFPWLDGLEAAADDIRDEMMAVLSDGPEVLEPYILSDGEPADRWRQLNNSRRWGVFYLWRTGTPVAANLARCPKTAAALEAWPKCHLLDTGPTAVFSILDAKTRIPPHVGVNNARLIVHLPLVVPPDCGFRVGAETRQWTPGEAFVFDDTIEHEAWNNSDQPRAVLILDIWNPRLSAAEREMVTALSAGVGEFYGELPSYAGAMAV